MSNLAASNGDEPQRKTNQRPSRLKMSSLLKLPQDIVLNILARIPKRHYPVLCCVSNSLRSLVRSPEISKTRYLLGKYSLYIYFIDKTKFPHTFHWFTLRRIENNNTTENVFVSVDFPLLPNPCHYSSSVVAVGPEIFFIPGFRIPSSTFWILDTQSGKARQGPCSMLVKRRYNRVGLVGGKIYVIGGNIGDEIPAESFDLKTQSWEAAGRRESLIYQIGKCFTWQEGL